SCSVNVRPGVPAFCSFCRRSRSLRATSPRDSAPTRDGTSTNTSGNPHDRMMMKILPGPRRGQFTRNSLLTSADPVPRLKEGAVTLPRPHSAGTDQGGGMNTKRVSLAALVSLLAGATLGLAQTPGSEPAQPSSEPPQPAGEQVQPQPPVPA